MVKKNVGVRLSSSNYSYIPSSRYLSWIDEHWYGTQNTLAYFFEKEQVEQIKNWLRNSCFIYHAEFIYADGTLSLKTKQLKKYGSIMKELTILQQLLIL